MKWLIELQEKWSAAISHMFILHFNVGDMVNRTASVLDCLLQAPLFKDREIVIQYNRSAGIQFPIPSHKRAFLEALALDVPDDPERIDEELVLLLPKAPEEAFGVIEKLLRKSKKNEDGDLVPIAGLIIDYADLIVPNCDTATMSPGDRYVLNTLLRWAKELVHIGSPIVLMVENVTDLHPALRASSSRIEAVRVPLPALEERKRCIEELRRGLGIELEVDTDHAARLTAALKLIHIEDIFLRCDIAGTPVTEEAIKLRKKEIIASEFADVIEIIEPEQELNIGGMDHIIETLQKNVIQPIKSGNFARVPMGILFAGPPGTGKTLFAKYLAKATGFNCVALNQSKITDKWVGSSERNLQKAFECFDALAPTIVVIDEIDQMGLSRENSGDSGVSNRQFKMLLEYMSDTRHRGKIVFVGLTNRPDLMDPALKRAGRFDRIIPVLPPELDQRKDIFGAIFKRYRIPYDLSDADLNEVAEATEEMTGADIEALVLKSYEVAQDGGSDTVTVENVKCAVSMYRIDKGRQNEFIKLALRECKFLDDLPPKYREKMAQEQGEPVELSGPRRRRG